MLTDEGRHRAVMDENFWTVQEPPANLECPPSGRSLVITYENGDHLAIRFGKFERPVDLLTRFPAAGRIPLAAVIGRELSYPLTLIEVENRIPSLGISFGARESTIASGTLSRNVSVRCAAGIVVE
jgi:hypothetical protein